ncbi:hypothetical protein [Bradyrhizobium sp. LTSP857]|uniref:hypothetical protein n=1 Tax=Bradyrhizobium sp. LTSP857 TaxID=1619231 RepID=UPI0005D2C3B7|nr:hypothetical protein [Bradyrhizobium sp. LTSP857]KJC37714.1 hypothetical protein UP06_30370 [Bradyrhizobium sp. LTSP857]
MSNVIDLSAMRAARVLPPQNVAEVEMAPREMQRQLRWQQEPPQTETARNTRLRHRRRDAWYAAEARTRYWSARMKLHSAIDSAGRWGAFPKGLLEEEHDHEPDTWMSLVRCFRSALAKQLLTPAWQTAGVTWKQKALAAGRHKYTDLTDEQIESAIQQDIEFLAAHPRRRKREEASA